NLLLDQPGYQLRVFSGAYAVVDTADLEQIERFPDVFRRAFLTRMGHREKALGASLGEHPLELARWMAHFGTVQPHGEERIAKRHGLLQRRECRFLGEM